MEGAPDVSPSVGTGDINQWIPLGVLDAIHRDAYLHEPSPQCKVIICETDYF